MKNVVLKGIYDHLISLGYSESNSTLSAQFGWEFFERSVCNSRDPFKDACDHAGARAQTKQTDIKYKSPKAKTKPRAKKPQDAFNFD